MNTWQIPELKWLQLAAEVDTERRLRSQEARHRAELADMEQRLRRRGTCVQANRCLTNVLDTGNDTESAQLRRLLKQTRDEYETQLAQLRTQVDQLTESQAAVQQQKQISPERRASLAPLPALRLGAIAPSPHTHAPMSPSSLSQTSPTMSYSPFASPRNVLAPLQVSSPTHVPHPPANAPNSIQQPRRNTMALPSITEDGTSAIISNMLSRYKTLRAREFRDNNHRSSLP